jgi:hypothetical protein
MLRQKRLCLSLPDGEVVDIVYDRENIFLPLFSRPREIFGGFIKGILRGVRCTKSLRVLFLHRRPPSWTTLVLYSRAVFIFNEPAFYRVILLQLLELWSNEKYLLISGNNKNVTISELDRRRQFGL